MKTKKLKPLSFKMAAHTRLHIKPQFITNSRFALRASLFHVFGLDVGEDWSYEVNGRGQLYYGLNSSLHTEAIERVFTLADACDYENVEVHGPDKDRYKIVGATVDAFIQSQYRPLFERLEELGGQWQINTEPGNLKALRCVFNGKTEALLMPVKVHP